MLLNCKNGENSEKKKKLGNPVMGSDQKSDQKYFLKVHQQQWKSILLMD